jgi:hypothetical protein
VLCRSSSGVPKGQHFFVDTELFGVRVGQTWEEKAGQWKVGVNDDYVTARDLKDAHAAVQASVGATESDVMW